MKKRIVKIYSVIALVILLITNTVTNQAYAQVNSAKAGTQETDKDSKALLSKTVKTQKQLTAALKSSSVDIIIIKPSKASKLSIPSGSYKKDLVVYQAYTTLTNQGVFRNSKIIVSSQAQFDKAVKTKNIDIIYVKTSKSTTLTIGKGSKKTELIINAPKCNITNAATWKKVSITNLSNSSWTEKAENNQIEITGDTKSVVIEKKATVKSIIINQTKVQTYAVKIKADGKVKAVKVESLTNIAITGTNANAVRKNVSNNTGNTIVITVGNKKIELESKVQVTPLPLEASEKTVTPAPPEKAAQLNTSSDQEDTDTSTTSTPSSDAKEPAVTTTPSEPTAPSVPTIPTAPMAPSIPTAPIVPTTPTVPTAPATPSVPTEPITPSIPTVPTEPTTPSMPTGPSEPTTPSTPPVLTEPIPPATPTIPTEPTPPVTPTTPAEGTDPTVPEAPVTPTEPTHSHSYTASVAKEATCTEVGVISYRCIAGDYSYSDVIAAKGHTPSAWTSRKAASYTECGLEVITCTVCKRVLDTREISIIPHEHSYTAEVIKEAVCMEAGVLKKTCSICNASYTEATPAHGHSYLSKVTKEATTAATGIVTYTCSSCNDSFSETIPMLTDSTDPEVTEPVAGIYTVEINSTDGKTPSTVRGRDNLDLAYEVFHKVNALRASLGLKELTWDNTLDDYTQLRAAEVTLKFSHERPNGERGYQMHPSITSENIAVGYATADAVMEAWKDSPSHYQAMINPNYDTMAVGCFEEAIFNELDQPTGAYYTGWVQFFHDEDSGILIEDPEPEEETVNGHKLITVTIDLGNGQTKEVKGYYDDNIAKEVYVKLNNLRSGKSLNALIWNSGMAPSADVRAAELTVKFDHWRPNGEYCYDIYPSMSSENVAMGYVTSDAVMTGWINSTSHYNAMIKADYQSVSISCFMYEALPGQYLGYWSMLFSKTIY